MFNLFAVFVEHIGEGSIGREFGFGVEQVTIG